MNAVNLATNGEVSGMGFKLKLASGGPGAVIAGLGVWLLLSVVNRPMEISVTAPTVQRSSMAYLTAEKAESQKDKCFLYIKTRKFDTGLGDITQPQVESAAEAAAAALHKAAKSGIEDPEERSETIRILNRLAGIVRESNAR